MGISFLPADRARSLTDFLYGSIWIMSSRILQGDKALKLWLWLWQMESGIRGGLDVL